MSDLKNQIFALLKKCPDSAGTHQIYYYTDSTAYVIALASKFGIQGDIPDYSAILTISKENGLYRKTVELTEKEYMDIKWTIEEWAKDLKEKAFEEFAKFAEREPNSMDDLLND